jgi:hypothetical protein
MNRFSQVHEKSYRGPIDVGVEVLSDEHLIK